MIKKKTKIPNYKILTDALVDGEQWYTVRVYKPWIMNWISVQPHKWQVELNNTYPHGRQWDVHEKLLTMLSLRWA